MMPKKDPGPSVKDKKLYEKLRDEGNSKQKAARIANAAAGSSRKKVSKKGGRSPSYDDWTLTKLRRKAKQIGIKGRSAAPWGRVGIRRATHARGQPVAAKVRRRGQHLGSGVVEVAVMQQPGVGAECDQSRRPDPRSAVDRLGLNGDRSGPACRSRSASGRRRYVPSADERSGRPAWYPDLLEQVSQRVESGRARAVATATAEQIANLLGGATPRQWCNGVAELPGRASVSAKARTYPRFRGENRGRRGVVAAGGR
jgi:hypothetical protein